MQTLHRLLALAAVSVTAAVSSHASTFADISVLDGSFADWADVPSLVLGESDGLEFNHAPGGGLDIVDVKLANNGTHLFALVTFATAVNPNNPLFVGEGATLHYGIDKDLDINTGNNVWGLNRLGIETVWKNDSGFEAVSNNAISSGAGISPYYTVTTQQEISVSRAAVLGDGLTTVFSGGESSFKFTFYTTGNDFYGPGSVFDEIVVGTYTFAAAPVPEPSAFAALAGLGVLGLAATRRRR